MDDTQVPQANEAMDIDNEDNEVRCVPSRVTVDASWMVADAA